MRSHELFTWHGVKKLEQISVQVGVPPLDGELRRKAETRNLSAQAVESDHVRLKTGQ